MLSPTFTLVAILCMIAVVIFAITTHEAAHAFVAKICGDGTAHALGRATLNPIVHIDLLGTIIVPMAAFMMGGFIFGWAKPVPVHYDRLRDQKIDPALVAAAGPFSNFALALLFAFLFIVSTRLGLSYDYARILKNAVAINLIIMLFNLIPILPLDGGRILHTFLPFKYAQRFAQIEPYGFIVIMILAFAGAFKFIIQPLQKSLSSVMLF